MEQAAMEQALRGIAATSVRLVGSAIEIVGNAAARAARVLEPAPDR